MRHAGFSYTVSAKVVLTFKDLKELWAHSNAHYDGRCRAASKRGPDGFIYGWVNQLISHHGLTEQQESDLWAELTNAERTGGNPPNRTGHFDKLEIEVWPAKFRHFDRCCKILETPLLEHKGSNLPWDLRQVLVSLNEETRRLND